MPKHISSNQELSLLVYSSSQIFIWFGQRLFMLKLWIKEKGNQITKLTNSWGNDKLHSDEIGNII